MQLADYRGLGWRRPALGLAMAVFLLSLAGFPPTGGFVAKLFLLRAAVDAGLAILAVTLVVTSLVSYYYYFRVVWKMYFEEAPEELPLPAVPGRAFRFAAVACTAGVLATGVAPGPAIEGLERVGAELGDRAGIAAPASESPMRSEAPASSTTSQPAASQAPEAATSTTMEEGREAAWR